MPSLPAASPVAQWRSWRPVQSLVGMSPVRLAVTAAAVYGISFCAYAIVTPPGPGESSGPVPWASALAMIVLLIGLLLREPVRTLVVALSGALLLVLDIVNYQPAGNSGLYSIAAVVVLALYFSYLDRRRSLAAWAAASVMWGVASEVTDGTLSGITLQGIVPVLVVMSVTGWAVGVNMRSRRAAEADLANLTERRRRERIGLARELHDSVARDLTIITMQSAVLRTTDRPDEQATARAAIETTARSGLDALKRLLVVLQAEESDQEPVFVRDLDAESLPAAFAESARHLTMLGFQVVLGPVPIELPRAAETTAVRVVREGTTNITKHASPGALCSLECAIEGDHLVVEVVNDSREHHTPRVPSTGLGLDALGERLRLLGGTIDARREDGRWILEARIPLTPPLAGSLAPQI